MRDEGDPRAGRDSAPAGARLGSAPPAEREATEALNDLSTRRIGHVDFPQLFFDVTYVEARAKGGLSQKAVVTTIGVTAAGDAETLGVAVGDCESKEFWSGLLLELHGRGLRGVRRVVCEPHGGLDVAVTTVLVGATYAPMSLDAEPTPDR